MTHDLTLPSRRTDFASSSPGKIQIQVQRMFAVVIRGASSESVNNLDVAPVVLHDWCQALVASFEHVASNLK